MPQIISPVILSKPEQISISSPVISSSYQKQNKKSEKSEEIIVANKAEDSIKRLVSSTEDKIVNEQKVENLIFDEKPEETVEERNEKVVEKINLKTNYLYLDR